MDWSIVYSPAGLAAVLVLVTIGFHFLIYWIAKQEVAKDWLKGAVGNDYTELPKENLGSDSASPRADWLVRLQEQYEDVRRHSSMQLKAYMDLQYQYYAATITWTVLAAAASVLGIFVVKDGWSGADPFVRSAALTVTLLFTFWQAIPKLLSMSSNIAAAKKSYLACVQLGNEMRSFARQAHTSADATKTAADVESDFINKADKRFSEIRNLNFDIDITQAPNFRKAIQDEMK